MKILVSTLLFFFVPYLLSNFVFGQSAIPDTNRDILWIKPQKNSFLALQNQTMEIAIDMDPQINSQVINFLQGQKGERLNPYDPEQLDVRALFTSATGNQKKGIGFYYQDFSENLALDLFKEKQTPIPWRIRFAPDEIGTWDMLVEIRKNGVLLPYSHVGKFVCETSNHRGQLVVHSTGTDEDRFLYYKQSGKRFIPAGMNVSNGGFFSYKPSQNRRHMGGVDKLAAAKGNFIRFEIGAQNALPDWNDLFNYQNKQDEMFAFDRTLALAESHQIYAIFFRHHVEIYGDVWDVPNWQNNPYRKQFNMLKISDYYTNPEALKLQKMNLRYMYARWGYSPYWAFYGYSEIERFIDPVIEQEGISDDAAIQLFKNWFEDQKKYIQEELNPDALFANSYGLLKKEEKKQGYSGIISASDVSALHIYSTVKNANYVNRAESVEDAWKANKQPVILEEMGINNDKIALYCCTGIEFHNSMWSTAFMGTFGPGLDWWWDRGVMDFNYEKSIEPLQKFLEPLQNEKKNFHPYRWADKKEKTRKIETFALISDDLQEIYGWLHNASYYWRNLANQSTCIQSLLDSSNLATDCFVGENMRMGRNESPRDYARSRHNDKYTDKGGVQHIDYGLEKNPFFVIEEAKKGCGKNRTWYKVEFFSTRPSDNLLPLRRYDQIVRTRAGRKLYITVPNLDDQNPDMAYKITFLSKGKKQPNL